MQAATVKLLLDLNRQFYHSFAAPFSATRQRIQPGVRLALQLLPHAGRWLDLGCGNGELARSLAAGGFAGEYVGMDFSEGLLEEARKTFGLGGDRLHPLVSSEGSAAPPEQTRPHPPAPSPLHGEGEKERIGEERRSHLIPGWMWAEFRAAARHMRVEPTEAERVLWDQLCDRQLLGLNFRRQQPIDPFIVDFYCPEISLVIEVDGEIHRFTQEQDRIRQEYLESVGLSVLRFSNQQVLTALNRVLQQIEQTAIALRAASAPPLHVMERGPGGEVGPAGADQAGTQAGPSALPLHVLERGSGGEVGLAGADQAGPYAPSASFSFHLSDLSNPHWSDLFAPGSFDVVLAFAVLHHLPGLELRLHVLRQARLLLGEQGLLVHSEWQFQNSPRLVRRIQPWERVGLAPADVEEGDTLLDWRAGAAGEPGLRYVHRFSLPELSDLAENSGFKIVQTFESDGLGERLGLYQVWQAD